jgi:AraC-like DNA-binding protein
MFIMRKPQDITRVGFKAPSDARLTVEAMSIDTLRQRAPADHFEKLQRADFYRLIGVLDEHTHLMVDFSSFAAKAGDWLLVRPGQVFRYDFSRPWAGWLVAFRPDSLSVLGQGRASDAIDLGRQVEDLACLRSLNAVQHDWMNRCMQQLQQDGALTADVGLRNELLRLQLASILLRLSLWQSQDSVASTYATTEKPNFRRFRQLLNADFATQHQVQHYAGVLGMSEKTLSRACVAATGVPAKAVINQRLVLEAKRLLAHTSRAVQTIGSELGFEEPSNFVKFFRKETGSRPLEFRVSQQADSQA